jgi:uncharacterized membrane protein YhaH (DUF805 family)
MRRTGLNADCHGRMPWFSIPTGAIVQDREESMGFSEAIRTCFRKYVGFSGRAARPEYWWFVLFVFIGSILGNVIDRILFGGGPMASTPVTSIFQLAIFLPIVAAGWRRMQDTGKPGWLILLPVAVSLISMVGLMGGVFGFGMMQHGGMAPEALNGPAAMMGGAGFIIAVIVQLVVAVLMIWWLTRPGDPGANRYGPPPA